MSVFAIAIKKPSSPPVENWVSHYDNTDFEVATYGAWDAGNSEWDGTLWSAQNRYSVQITSIGTWTDLYRPTHVRITYTGSPIMSVQIQSVNLAVIRNISPLVSGTSYALTFEGATSPYDIWRFWAFETAENPISIQNIEWYEA